MSESGLPDHLSEFLLGRLVGYFSLAVRAGGVMIAHIGVIIAILIATRHLQLVWMLDCRA